MSKPKKEEPIEFPADCLRIQSFLENKGRSATVMLCDSLWADYSESISAHWLIVNDASLEDFLDWMKDYIP